MWNVWNERCGEFFSLDLRSKKLNIVPLPKVTSLKMIFSSNFSHETSEGSRRNRFHISNSRQPLIQSGANLKPLATWSFTHASGSWIKFPLALCDNFLCYHALLTGDTLEIRSKLPAWIVPCKISNTISGFASPAGIYNHCSFLKQWVMKWSDQINLPPTFFFFFFFFFIEGKKQNLAQV